MQIEKHSEYYVGRISSELFPKNLILSKYIDKPKELTEKQKSP